jgi:Gpi18-like mannosyltransferase
MGVVYGLNDALVAALLTGAVIFRHQNKYKTSGILIALAGPASSNSTLFSYCRFFRLRMTNPKRYSLSAGLLFFILGMAAAYLAWGSSIFHPFLFGSHRGPKLLSIEQTHKQKKTIKNKQLILV